MSDILNRIDLNSTSSSNAMPRPHDDMPVPRSFLQRQTQSNALVRKADKHPMMDGPQRFSPAKVCHDHASDSGLGSSISSSQGMMSEKGKVAAGQLSVQGFEPSALTTQSAITSSVSALQSNALGKRSLSALACKQVEALVMIPILKEERLKPFHPLVESIPQLVENKEIACLRDIEKTLLWLAPQRATSGTSYFRFCEFTIQCLHTSLYHINELDQRLPSDRPYTNGYFLDLIEQVRRHAAIIHESRNKNRAAGKARLALEGGMTKTGRPAELVTYKDGQAISMKTGQAYNGSTLKRNLSFNSADEGVVRSMARRKKNAPPMDINQKCSNCEKVFKRPCDLTKHEKTHSRPWKCTDKTCKYYEIGWPTEKERDRHINDKHSKSPSVYYCLFSPCPYQSKRESNCKQHMEKTHGWAYVRSKHNGKGLPKTTALATPQSSSMATPASASATLSTPATGSIQSPYESATGPAYSNPQFSFANPPAQTGAGDFQLFPEASPYRGSSSSASVYTGGASEFDPFPTGTAGLDAFQSQLENADPTGLLPPNMANVPLDVAIPDFAGAAMGFGGSPMTSTDSSSLDLEWSNMGAQNFNNELATTNMQMVTSQPAGGNAMQSYSEDPYMADPLAYTQFSQHLDEGFADLCERNYQTGKFENDFPLFQNPTYPSEPMNNALAGMGDPNAMFPTGQPQEQAGYYHQAWPAEVDISIY